jgi:hypothetical protein
MFDDGAERALTAQAQAGRMKADYRRYAKKFLAPYHDLLVELLAGLKAESQATLF